LRADFFFALSLDFSKTVPIVSRIKMTGAEKLKTHGSCFGKTGKAGQNTSTSSGFDSK